MDKSLGKVAVIGGGVSGMAAAAYLSKAGVSVDLYEAGTKLGGRMAIDQLNNREVCLGGKNIGSQYKEFREFLSRYGAPHYEYFGINSARVSGQKLHVFNSQRKIRSLLTLMQSANLKDLWKIRLALRAIKSDRRNGDLGGPYFKARSQDAPQTIEQAFSPKFSTSFLRALTVRMNGAEPEDVSLETLGTHLQMVQDEYEQLNTPISRILDGFCTDPNITVYLNTPVKNIRHMAGFYAVTGEGFMSVYANLIVALPATAARGLMSSDFSCVGEILERPRYYPVTVLVAQYEKPVFGHDIRALTYPVDSAISNVGAYGAQDLNLVRYTFSGRTAQSLKCADMDDAALLSIAEEQAKPYFNIEGNQCDYIVRRSWPKGLCGYARNEAKFKTDLRASLMKFPRLYLTGDYIKGASIENCFRASKRAAADCLAAMPADFPKQRIYHVN